MEPLYFVMAILGCGDGNTACTEARVTPVHYTTLAQCRAALPDGIARNTDISFPVIAANCRANGNQVAQASTKPVRG